MAGNGGGSEPKGSRAKPVLPDEVKEEIREMLTYGVGYKRPPKTTRFRKGQSGNPRGRPKREDLGIGGSRSLDALVLAEAERRVTIREGDETREITAVEAVQRSQLVSATKGSPHAQRNFLDRYGAAELRKRRQIEKQNEIWRQYVTRTRDEIAEAERNGDPPPNPLPHPDDVIIDHERGVRFVGPIDEEGATRFEETCRLRDILLMQQALDEREAGHPTRVDSNYEPGAALLLATILNESLPPRMRLSDQRLIIKLMDHETLTKRELLKRLYREWRALGYNFRRGAVSASMSFVRARLEFLYDLAAASIDGKIDLDAIVRGELDSNARRLFAKHVG
jgi:hypothetical protein